ncbi:hypothetical protein M3580_12045 [Bacillus safensis]|uniref:hypothetical protein n=1 Tax=Bacillus safensis TaxID=561879 RepID=UPI002041968A|nr:hypothetical protein [Bacillus safensis]MCM2989957.1 hypothetical protein [Bacillus safensis]
MGKKAIKINPKGPINKYVLLLRKYTGLGITDIKNTIENKGFFAETDESDIDSMEDLKELADSLLNLGADVKIYDNDDFGEGIFDYREISYEEFINNINRLKEIIEELQDYDDAISDE